MWAAPVEAMAAMSWVRQHLPLAPAEETIEYLQGGTVLQQDDPVQPRLVLVVREYILLAASRASALQLLDSEQRLYRPCWLLVLARCACVASKYVPVY